MDAIFKLLVGRAGVR